jgi:subtilisin family serine protease
VSPGNSPYAITVGAIDTAGTISRSDDRVAAYSSRGPTVLDLAVKPDVVAPGSRLVSLEARGSLLSTQYPNWHIAGSGTNAYFRLSGTSMATAVVSGGVALLLDANAGLTPGQVKVALQMGATFVPDAGLIGAGAGSVNFQTSQNLAQGGLLPGLLNTVLGLLGPAGGATFRDSGTLIERIYGNTGLKPLNLIESTLLWLTADTAESGVLNLLGLTNPLARIPANFLVWGEVAGWTTNYHVVWSDSIQSPTGQHVVWSDTAPTDANHVVWSDSMPDGSR